jgi:hypothetical protein
MLKRITRILSLQFSQTDIFSLDKRYFIVGLVSTWLVGMGRYWDNPRANLGQHLGVGSVIYIFVLSAFIWLIVLPFKLKNWSYFRLLTYISLCSIPAILYAIPVEKFMPLATAKSVNAWFLGIVALWRILLLFRFLKMYDDLKNDEILTCVLLPIVLIINGLAYLNLEHVVFNIMSGNDAKSANDTSYFIVLVLTIISWILVLPLLINYFYDIHLRRKKVKTLSENAED